MTAISNICIKSYVEWTVQSILAVIDRLPYPTLIMMTVLLGLAPFVPEPHLVEKFRWLATGHPFRPIDVFDVFWHIWPVALLATKYLRSTRR